jgi:hypothetical protein
LWSIFAFGISIWQKKKIFFSKFRHLFYVIRVGSCIVQFGSIAFFFGTMQSGSFFLQYALLGQMIFFFWAKEAPFNWPTYALSNATITGHYNLS